MVVVPFYVLTVGREELPVLLPVVEALEEPRVGQACRAG
jgi:hypothetical protein